MFIPISDNRPQAIQMTRHMPTDPVFFNALAGDTNIPDPTNQLITHWHNLKLMYYVSTLINTILRLKTTHPTLH